ncbi:SCO-spondin-like isoform X3 [Dreissena polymorpha]|uniref:SCO-spondin-like isoform X3 n=1 Tax=Dreissena polymorpha TaxID=45954 RepID=UPI002264320D|nr:SCO-spondin-like isoform X3 [Dreissena polymorpha]
MDFSHVFVLIFCVLGTNGVRGSDFCYSCMGMTNRNECQQIKECQQNQYCLLQRVSDGISVTYNIGCSDQTVCPASNKGEILIIGRSVSSDNSDCTSCCHDDLCIPNDCSLIMDTTTVETAVTATVTTAATTPFAKTSTTSVVETGSAWSDWSPWTPCPYTCGHDGIQHRFRHCTVTAFGCEGPKFESKICHSRVCCTGRRQAVSNQCIPTRRSRHCGDFQRLRRQSWCVRVHSKKRLRRGSELAYGRCNIRKRTLHIGSHKRHFLQF